jgi:type II secretory ATPase GspE/PulE/Tfp pilus assembly ATPase PilB-like protein
VFEMLTVDDTIRNMIVGRAPSMEIKQHAVRSQGMMTLMQDGRRRVLDGDTTVREVLRVCQREDF